MSDYYIQSASDLKQYFIDVRNSKSKFSKGINVSSKVRKDFILGDDQGKVIINGRVITLEFKSLGGGAYLAKIPEADLAASTFDYY